MQDLQKKKKLDEIEEVYEELSGFIAHTKLAFKSFAYLIYYSLKILFTFIFSKCLFALLEKIIWVLFIVIVFLFTILAFLGTGISKLFNRKDKTPFGNKANRTRLDMLDKIQEKKKFTLALDLDGTLIFASKVKKEKLKRGIKCEKKRMEVVGGQSQSLYLYPRPYLDEFLTRLSEHYNIVIFSAAEESYINMIVDSIDRWQAVKKRFDRTYCDIHADGKIQKDLTKIFEKGILNTIMVEDAPRVCIQQEHTILLSKWEAKDPKDTDLKHLCEFLLENCENVQTGKQLVELYDEIKVKTNQQESRTGVDGNEEAEGNHTDGTSVVVDDTITGKDQESPTVKMQSDSRMLRFDTDQDTIKDDTDTESRLADVEHLLHNLPPTIQVLSPQDE